MKIPEIREELLTIPQEFAFLISKVAQREIDFFVEDDVEFLHEFRVDLRKLRTWTQIFETADYRVKKIQKHLARCHLMGGEVRNFDVLLSWLDENQTFASLPYIRILKEKRKKLRKMFLKELVKTDAISQLRILGRNFLLHIKGVSKEVFEPQVKRYIEEKKKSVYAILPKALTNLEELHEVRKILKKIRYALLLLPTFNQNCLQNLKELQDILGYINDRRVWLELILVELKDMEEAKNLQEVLQQELNAKLDEFKTYVASEKTFLS